MDGDSTAEAAQAQKICADSVQTHSPTEYNGTMETTNNRLAARLLLAHFAATGNAMASTRDLENLKEFDTSDAVRRRTTFRVTFTHHAMTGELYYNPDEGYGCPEIEAETGDMVEVLTPKVESNIQYTKFTPETASHLAELVATLDAAMKVLQPAMAPQKVVIKTAQQIADYETKLVAAQAAKEITDKAKAAAESVRKHMKVGAARPVPSELLTGVPVGTMNLEFEDYGGKHTRRYTLDIAENAPAVLTRLADKLAHRLPDHGTTRSLVAFKQQNSATSCIQTAPRTFIKV